MYNAAITDLHNYVSALVVFFTRMHYINLHLTLTFDIWLQLHKVHNSKHIEPLSQPSICVPPESSPAVCAATTPPAAEVSETRQTATALFSAHVTHYQLILLIFTKCTIYRCDVYLFITLMNCI